jgi:transposase InsO family protein
MAKSTYYYQFSHPKTDRYASLRKRIAELYTASGSTYGCRRMTLALKAEGVVINHKTVERIMSAEGMKALQKRKRYRSYKGEVGHIADNIINRNFVAHRPNEKWATDISQINIGGDKIYFSTILDMFNGEVVSYAISAHPDLKLVTDMLRRAEGRLRNAVETILHSDQGWQYQHPGYCRILKKMSLIQSMSRKGNCYDNAIMESFFGTMKSELLYLCKFASVSEFVKALKDYICYYNNKRIKLRLGMSPVQYRIYHINK